MNWRCLAAWCQRSTGGAGGTRWCSRTDTAARERYQLRYRMEGAIPYRRGCFCLQGSQNRSRHRNSRLSYASHCSRRLIKKFQIYLARFCAEKTARFAQTTGGRECEVNSAFAPSSLQGELCPHVSPPSGTYESFGSRPFPEARSL
jgi:hypothetical protein